MLPRFARTSNVDATVLSLFLASLLAFSSGHEAFLAYVTSIEAFLAPATGNDDGTRTASCHFIPVHPAVSHSRPPSLPSSRTRDSPSPTFFPPHISSKPAATKASTSALPPAPFTLPPSPCGPSRWCQSARRGGRPRPRATSSTCPPERTPCPRSGTESEGCSGP